MERAGSLTVVCLIVALLAIGCGEPVGGSSGDSGESSAAPPGTVDAEDSDVPEEQLASIDETTPYPEGRTVRRFRFLLDGLEQQCPERRRRLADLAVNTQQLLDEEKGVDRSILEIMEEVAGARQVVGRQAGKCEQVFLLYLTTEGNP